MSLNFYQTLGAVIRETRIDKGLTLRQVSKDGYVSMGHLSDVERGRKEGSGVFLESVARALGVEAYELVIETGYRMAEARVAENAEDLLLEHA